MTETEVKTVAPETNDDEPIYYNPNRLSLISGIASWTSWFVLIFFLLDTVIQGIDINSQLKNQGLAISSLLTRPDFLGYLFTTVLAPIFTGLVFFLLLQAASIGLNVVLELDFNAREKK
jgi:hypothetical protein